ncbi:MAG: hypothetical protein CFE26_18475 [Verrucomicrobiales bacterium VVV1]|nr:MAG: hypothetical protein CFE26_18475 [Verrucomicrobiales bacterium VVV1]
MGFIGWLAKEWLVGVRTRIARRRYNSLNMPKPPDDLSQVPVTKVPLSEALKAASAASVDFWLRDIQLDG